MRIYLRPITLEDEYLIVKWRNSPVVAKHCFHKDSITIESSERFYKENIETGKYKQFIVERIDEDFGVSSYPIATIYLKDMDYENHRCELCFFTSDDQEWNTESQSIAIRMLLEKAISEYDIHKIYTYAYAENEDQHELLRAAGFTDEGVLKGEALNLNSEYSDVYRMAVWVGEHK